MSEATPAWLFNQAAVIPWRRENGALRVLLVTSSSGKRWVIPKGVVDPGETPHDSAAREAREEAGIAGRIPDAPVGSYTYEKWGGTCRVQVFLMNVDEVHERWSEQAIRQRRWMSLEKAAASVRERKLRRLLERLPALIRDHGAEAREPGGDPP